VLQQYPPPPPLSQPEPSFHLHGPISLPSSPEPLKLDWPSSGVSNCTKKLTTPSCPWWFLIIPSVEPISPFHCCIPIPGREGTRIIIYRFFSFQNFLCCHNAGEPAWVVQSDMHHSCWTEPNLLFMLVIKLFSCSWPFKSCLTTCLI
jgi:hypothetical protein